MKLSVAALAITGILASGGLRAQEPNWLDRYIKTHANCSQPLSFLTTEPFGKPIAQWTDDDLLMLKTALHRCELRSESEPLGDVTFWTVPIYEGVAKQVAAVKERKAVADAKIAEAKAQIAQDEKTRALAVTADKEAATARLAELKRLTEQATADRKAAEERAIAVAAEQEAASRLADEAEARAKAMQAEAEARGQVEATKRRAANAQRAASNSESEMKIAQGAANPPVQMAQPSFVNSIDEGTPCSYVVDAFDQEDRQSVAKIDRYINGVMRSLDRKGDQGRSGLLDRLTSDGYAKIRMAVVENCRGNRSETLNNSVAMIYDGFRGMHDLIDSR